MALQTANQFQLSPDLVGAASRGLQLGNQFRQSNQQAANQKLGTQQQAILDDLSSKAAAGDPQALTQLSGIAPDRAAKIQTFQATQQENKFKSVVRGAQEVQNIPTVEGKIAFLENRISKDLPSQGVTNTSDTQELLDLYKSGDIEGGNALVGQVVQSGVQSGFLKAAPVKKLSSLQQKVEAEGLDPLTPEGQARAREITQGSRTDPSLKPSDQQLINKASEGQLQSSTFANRVSAANEVLAELEATEGFDATSITAAFLESIPGGNIALSADQQRFSQAKRDFITAVLRKESGAAIGVDEFTNEDKKFFPQVGDKPAVLKQKALGRKRAFESLKKQSKGVFDVQFGNKSGALSDAEKAELEQLRAELG